MEIIKGLKKNTILLLLLTLIILYLILRDDMSKIMQAIVNMNYLCLIVAILLCFLSLIIKAYVLYNSVNNKEKLTLGQAIKHNIITQFFNGITPLSTGGQPMEIYMLIEKGINPSVATSIIVQNFIFYQTALVIFGVLAVLYNWAFQIFPSTPVLRNFVLLGFTINIIVVLVLYMIILSKKKVKKLLLKIIHLLAKLNIIKDEEQKKEIWLERLEEFHNSSKELRKRKTLAIKGIILNFVSLACLYIIPLPLIYGLNASSSLNIMDTLVASAYVLIIGAFIPAPGASGGIEYGFVKFFGNFIPKITLNATLLIWRFITYYLGMILGALLLNFKKKED